MRLNSWVEGLFQRLVNGKRLALRRRRMLRGSSCAMVERLEPRKLLSVGAIGVETRVNQQTSGSQDSPRMAMDPHGNYVTVWESYGQDGDDNGIFARRYNAAGVPQGSEFQVNTYTTGSQGRPAVAIDSSDDFVVTWVSDGQDGSGLGIFARRFSSLGVAQGGEFQVNTFTTNNQNKPSVGMDSAGDFIITWDDATQDGSNYGIYARLYNSSGTAQEANEFRVNTYTTNVQATPSVAMNATGSFVIAWDSLGQDGSETGVFAQRFNSSAIPVGTEFQVNTYTTLAQGDATVGIDPAGDFVIAWQSYGQDGSNYGIFAQRYSSSGAKQGSEFRVNTYTTSDQQFPSVAVDQAGDFVVAWESTGQDGSGYGVYCQRYSSNGQADGGEFRVNTTTTGQQNEQSVASDATGDFVVTWDSSGQDGSSSGVYSQRYIAAAGPIVSGVLLGNRVIQNGDKLDEAVPGVTVDFSGHLNTTSLLSVSNQQNWRLYSNGVQVPNSILSIVPTFDAATNQTSVNLTFSSPLGTGTYELVAKQSIIDIFGNPLDGDGNDVSGGDFQLTFSVGLPVPAGPMAVVNRYTTGTQARPSVATDAAGDYVVVWQSSGQDGSGYGVFGQRYNAAGRPQGGEFQVNSYTTGDQYGPGVAMDAAGNFVIEWYSSHQDGNGNGVFAQEYHTDGTKASTEFRVNTYTTGWQTNSGIGMDAQGDFVITWQSDNQDGSGTGVYARYFPSSGGASSEFAVNTYTTGKQTLPKVAMDSNGDFVITWQSDYEDGANYGIYAQRYTIGATPVGSEFKVNTYTTNNQTTPSVSMDSVGDFIIAWQSYSEDGSEYGCYAQLYNSAGTPQGAEIHVNTFSTNQQTLPVVGMDSAGDFVVTWRSYNQDGSNYGVFGRRFDSEGLALTDEFLVNLYTTGSQSSPAIAVDSVGDFVVAWDSGGEDGSSYGVYSRRYRADVAPVLSDTESALNAVGALSTPASSALIASDIDDSTWTDATIQIATNYVPGQDKLSFASQNGITGSWNAANGTMTLSGTSSVANYQAAMRSVTYNNTSATPNTALTRTIEFQGLDGILFSNAVTRQMNVGANSVLTGLGQTVNYTEGGSSLAFGTGMVATDPGVGNATRATITMTNWQPEDRLSFNNIFALQHTESIVGTTDTYTITGSASVDHYRTLLGSFLYWDASSNPNTSAHRVATFQIFFGSAASNTVSQTINVTSVDNAPVISSLETNAMFVQSNNPASLIPISQTLLLTDPDSVNCSKATVTIIGYQPGDKLNFTNHTGITGLFDSVAGSLTLSGTSSVSNYRTALRSVTFSTTAGTGVRSLSITVADDFSPTPAASPAATRQLAIVTTNSPPALTTGMPTEIVAYTRSTPGVNLATDLVVLDADGINLSGATIKITGNYQSATDVLEFTSAFGVTGSFSSSTGTLTLNGITSLANYQTLLRGVTFKTTTLTASTVLRTITFTINDGLTNSSPVTSLVYVSA